MSTPIPSRARPVVPDYEILRCIGRGTYGEVWMARSTLGTFRAVKIVYRDAFESERPYLREFAGIREFEPVSSHESQVRIYHVGQNTEAGYFYYVMDLADDASLASRAVQSAAAEQPQMAAVPVDVAGAAHAGYVPATLSLRLLEQGRLRVNECLDIAVALASALKHLHDHGLIHRDIKPSNIVFVRGRPKLADIGLVTSASTAATFVGTTGYIPPEGPGRPQADLYSLGKVFYEMAMGRDRADFPQLPEGFAALPERQRLLELNHVILKACQNDPSQRYASTAELHDDLVRLQLGQSLRNRHRLKKLRVAAAIAAASVLMAAGALALWRGFMPPRTQSTAPSGAVPPPGGLIAWWLGDGHANDIVGGHHGVPINGADYAPGLIGQAFRLNGTNQYFSIAHTPSLSFTNGQPFTLEAWVYRTKQELPFHVLGKRGIDDGYYQMGYDEGHIEIPMSTWIHLVKSHDGQTTCNYYNGLKVESHPMRCPGPNSGDFQIGSAHSAAHFGGLIDDVRIYSRALLPSEIRAIFVAGTNGMKQPSATLVQRRLPELKMHARPSARALPPGLIAWWPGDGHANDVVGNHHGVPINGADYAPGLFGQAFRVNGINQHFSVAHSPSLSFAINQPYTLEAWVYRTGGRPDYHVLGKRDTPFGCYYQFGAGPELPLNEWRHLVASSDGKSTLSYQNGILVHSNRTHCPGPNSADLRIGTSHVYYTFEGLIDDVRIYSRALTPPEIKANYDAGTNGISPPSSTDG